MDDDDAKVGSSKRWVWSRRRTRQLPRPEWTPCAEFNRVLNQYNDLPKTATQLSHGMQQILTEHQNGGDIQLLLKALLTRAERRCFLGTLRLFGAQGRWEFSLNRDAETKQCDMTTLFVGLRDGEDVDGHRVVVELFPQLGTGLFIDSNGSDVKAYSQTTVETWMKRIETVLLTELKVEYKLQRMPDVCLYLPKGLARVEYSSKTGPQNMQSGDRSTCWLWSLLSIVLLHKCRPALSMSEIIEHWKDMSPERLTELLQRFGMWAGVQAERHYVPQLVEMQDRVNEMRRDDPGRTSIQEAIDALDFPKAFAAYAARRNVVSSTLSDAYVEAVTERDAADDYRQLELDLKEFAKRLPADASPIDTITTGWSNFTAFEHALVMRHERKLAARGGRAVGASGGTTSNKKTRNTSHQQEQEEDAIKMLSPHMVWKILQFLSISERLLKAERSSRRLLTVSRSTGLSPSPHLVELATLQTREGQKQVLFWLRMLAVPFPMRIVSLDISADRGNIALYALGLYIVEHWRSLQRLNVHRDIDEYDPAIDHDTPSHPVELAMIRNKIINIANKEQSREVLMFWGDRFAAAEDKKKNEQQVDPTFFRALSFCTSLRQFLWQDGGAVFAHQGPTLPWHAWRELREFQLSSGPVCSPKLLINIAESCPHLEVLRLVAYPGHEVLRTGLIKDNPWFLYVLPDQFITRFATTLKTLVFGQELYVPKVACVGVAEAFLKPLARMAGLQKLGFALHLDGEHQNTKHVQEYMAKLVQASTWPNLDTLFCPITDNSSEFYVVPFGERHPVWRAVRDQKSTLPITLVLPSTFDADTRFYKGMDDPRLVQTKPRWSHLPFRLEESWQHLFGTRPLTVLPWKASLDWKTWTVSQRAVPSPAVPMSDDAPPRDLMTLK